MMILDYLKLRYRAYKYKNKDDQGGIAYVLESVKNGDTIMDIGCHKAGYLYFFIKKAGLSGKIFAFEPQTKLFQYIAHLKRVLNWKNVQIEQLALSDEVGTVTLYIPANEVSKGSSPGATIVEKKGQAEFGATEKVATNTIDAYCLQNQVSPNFLKIDVEGNELKVFKGGEQILRQYRPKILVEIEQRHVGEARVLETFEYLQSLGYRGYFIHGKHRHELSDFSFDKFQNQKDKANYCNNFVFE